LIGRKQIQKSTNTIKMNFSELLNDKSLKPKIRLETLSKWVLENPAKLDEFIDFAKKTKDPIKAGCIEAIEFATKTNPSIATGTCLQFVTLSLTEKAPRIKWESAKVIGNIAHMFPTGLDEAIKNLLVNTQHSGTVIRWSAAYALSQIIKIKTSWNHYLVPEIEDICRQEEKNGIRKIYLEALKKIRDPSLM
jgi:hypothetical protein